jgi:hypothetical protein
MLQKDCKVGTRVAQKSEFFPCEKGEIINDAVKYETTMVVEWDSGYISREYVSELITETEGLARDAQFQDEKEQYEAKFNAVRAEISSKMDAAAALIKDAHTLARGADRKLSELMESNDFIDAMGEAGWRTSSLSC